MTTTELLTKNTRAYLEASIRQRKEKWEDEWNLSLGGDIEHKRNGYYIDKERLSENWLEHMAEKTWVDMNTFVPAYAEACHRAGVSTVKIQY